MPFFSGAGNSNSRRNNASSVTSKSKSLFRSKSKDDLVELETLLLGDHLLLPSGTKIATYEALQQTDLLGMYFVTVEQLKEGTLNEKLLKFQDATLGQRKVRLPIVCISVDDHERRSEFLHEFSKFPEDVAWFTMLSSACTMKKKTFSMMVPEGTTTPVLAFVRAANARILTLSGVKRIEALPTTTEEEYCDKAYVLLNLLHDAEGVSPSVNSSDHGHHKHHHHHHHHHHHKGDKDHDDKEHSHRHEDREHSHHHHDKHHHHHHSA